MIEIDELRTLIPHSGKMLLLSRVLNYTIGNALQAEFDISEDCIFYDHNIGGIPAWIGFELIAQSACALLGIQNREKGIKPKIGLLLNVSLLKIDIPFYKIGSTIQIHVKEIDCTETIYTFEGEILFEGKSVVKGNIMVMELNGKDERFIEFTKKMDAEVVSPLRGAIRF